jgi:hypothetical protein
MEKHVAAVEAATKQHEKDTRERLMREWRASAAAGLGDSGEADLEAWERDPHPSEETMEFYQQGVLLEEHYRREREFRRAERERQERVESPSLLEEQQQHAQVQEGSRELSSASSTVGTSDSEVSIAHDDSEVL